MPIPSGLDGPPAARLSSGLRRFEVVRLRRFPAKRSLATGRAFHFGVAPCRRHCGAWHHGVMDRRELQTRADLNLVAAWREMGAAAGGVAGGTVDCPFLASGVPAAPFNAVFALSPVADPDDCVASSQGFMAEIGVPFLLWLVPGVN